MLGVRIREDTVYAERKRYLLAVGGAALVVLIVGSILANFAGRVLTRQIGVTLDALDSVGTGEFGVQIPGTGGQDELSKIQRRINDLADSFARRANERDAATRSLEENEKRFRDSAEATSNAFWETDAEHRYTFFNNPGTNFGHFQDNDSIVGTIRGQYFQEAGFYSGDWEEHIEDLNHHRIIRDFEFSGQYPDGKIFHRTCSADCGTPAQPIQMFWMNFASTSPTGCLSMATWGYLKSATCLAMQICLHSTVPTGHGPVIRPRKNAEKLLQIDALNVRARPARPIIAYGFRNQALASPAMSRTRPAPLRPPAIHQERNRAVRRSRARRAANR